MMQQYASAIVGKVHAMACQAWRRANHSNSTVYFIAIFVWIAVDCYDIRGRSGIAIRIFSLGSVWTVLGGVLYRSKYELLLFVECSYKEKNLTHKYCRPIKQGSFLCIRKAIIKEVLD